MDGLADLPAAHLGIGRGGVVRDLLTERLDVLMLGPRSVHGVSHPVLLGLAKMVNQQVAGDSCNPGYERALGMVIARKSAVHFDEYILGQVLGVVARSCETVADVVDAPVIGLHDFLPGGGVPGNTAPNQHRDDLDVFHLYSPETA